MTPRRAAEAILIILSAFACGRIPSGRAPVAKVWYVASPAPSGENSTATGFIFLDTASLRPMVSGATASSPKRAALFTSFQGSRYHPESVRAVAEDSSVLDGFARAFARLAGAGGQPLVIDIQDMAAEDISRMTSFVRTLARSFRSSGASPVAVVVPAGDTVSYPTAVLGRVADVIIVRLTAEHRPGTRPGPLVTQDFVRRALGMRATSIGVTRLGAEFPLYGYIWNRDGSARRITYREANDLVLRESGAFRRDPGSAFLTASGREGWTIWVPDARTVEALVNAALKRGVNIVALAGTDGADPSIFAGDSATR